MIKYLKECIYAQGQLQHLGLWNHLEKLALIFLYNFHREDILLQLVTKIAENQFEKHKKLEFFLEIEQLEFYKYIFNLKISTPSAMIFGEMGILQLRSDIQFRMISFQAKINEDVEEYERKLSPLIYINI